MLEVRKISVEYGGTRVLWDISLTVGAGEIVAILGPNGSGKSTVLKAIVGLKRPSSGSVWLDGQDISRVPTHEMPRLGVNLVLERRRLFPTMSVHENVMMGAFHKHARPRLKETLEWVEGLFPIIRERRSQMAFRLSGGEQQMVAIARGLMSRPRLLLLDEPFLGLTPRMVEETMKIIRRINADGVSVLFNEQNVRVSFGNSDRGYLLESGRLVLEGSGLEMLGNDIVKTVYLGNRAG
ncbi:MAG TPA: ABC transporter ATP-binding protein [Bauldia sp.]|nr:ABC transporter ATP-binding protein [Bauldia sp.]